MEKDRTENLRRYSTEAFRLYALRGKDITTDDFNHWLDCQAVSQTLSLFRSEGKLSIIEVLECVYFKEPDKPLVKKDIEYRVINYCMNHHVGRTTVYRWLAHARSVFLSLRNHDKSDI